MVSAHIVPRLGHIPLRSLTERNLVAATGMVRGRSVSAARSTDRAPRTPRSLPRSLSEPSSRSVNRNVAENVGDELPRVECREMTTLTIDEVVQLEREAKSTELEVPLLVAIDSGVRRGELVALRWSDVDLESRRVVIRRSLEALKSTGSA